MARLLIVIIFYALAAFTLPSWPPFAQLLGTLARLPAQTAYLINIGALVGASGLLYLLMRTPGGLFHRYAPGGLASGGLTIVRTGLIGVIFAALYGLFEAMSGYAITVINLAILPPAFMAGEAAFVALQWAWSTLTPHGRRQKAARKTVQQARQAAAVFDAADSNEAQEKAGVPRLLITIPVYVFVLVYLPRQEDFRSLEAKLINVSPAIALSISVAALVCAAVFGLLYLKRLEKHELPLTGDPYADTKTMHFQQIKQMLVLTVAIGLAIAALLNIVGYFANYPPSLSTLILMPVGFTLAEALYEGLNWRLKYGPPEV